MKEITKNQIISFESLRGIAAIAVAMAHVFQFFLARYHPEYYRAVGLVAQASVMIFFVMSGFLIGVSIQNNISKNGGFSMSTYAISRFRRIYPPLVLSLIIILLMAVIAPYVFESGAQRFATASDEFIKGRGIFYWPSQIFSVLTFTNGLLPQGTPFNTPLWSLPFEAWYYVLAALLFTKKPFYIALAFILAYAISGANIKFMIFGAVWFAGLGLSLVDIKGKVHTVAACILTAITSWFAFAHGAKFIATGGDYTMFNMWFGLAFASLTYLFILCMNVRINIIPSSSKYSYTLYIIHYPIIMFMIGIFESMVIGGFYSSLMIAVCATVIFMALAYKASQYVENPNLIKRFM
ncbi:acyltransferase family protein [Enterobacter cloacae]|uniref:acyltransferase family protein n=1 Tax=Enterobacter cloacae TaxID=550 RepID=UPI002A81FD27|nr:acyltransferase [Enterobacter cloacae]